MTSTDLFQQRVKECRRLAAAARNANDRAFWLRLVERWHALESRGARQQCVRQDALVGHLQEHSPGRGGQAARAAKAKQNDVLSPACAWPGAGAGPPHRANKTGGPELRPS
jgi:hypothetical protein